MTPATTKLFIAPATLAVVFSISSFLVSNASPLPESPDKNENAAQNDLYANKRNASQYWAEFRQDSNQTWSDTKSAFRDGWVEGKLETALLINERLTPFSIDINVENNTAVLRGEVGSEIDRELAENIALGIEGIDSVDNRLSVNRNLASKTEEEDEEEDHSAGERNFSQYMSDISTTAEVKNELLKSPQISGMAIDVDTYNAKVTLRGTVKTRQEREMAEAIVNKLGGVRKVNNALEVAS